MNISLFQAASALNANNRWQEAISQNMAASNVPGYKSQHVSFAAIERGMMPAGTSPAHATGWTMPAGSTGTNFIQGEMRFTGQPTDVGIQGPGFFEIQLPNGALGYTRDGEFQINSNGALVTKQGHLVMSDGGPIQMDRNSSDPISIAADGTVSQGQNVKGTIKIVDYTNPHLLTPISGGVYVAQNPNLEVATNTTRTVRQNYLEQSNANSVTQMADLITVMRASEANQRIIQMQDERMGRAITELGNPS